MESGGYDQFHMKCDISCSSLPDFSFVTISIYIIMFLFSVIMDISELNNLTADDVNNYDEYGETYLIKAARTKNPERATELLGALISKGADVNIMSKWHGYTALWHAVNTNCRESVELLLQANANPNIGHSPIVIASGYPDDVNFVDMLLQVGADVNNTDKYGSMVRTAILFGNHGSIKKALVAGAKVNNTSNPFNGPLHNHYNESALMLLFAAGENLQYFNSNAAPKAIHEIKKDRSLTNLCQQEIRKYLSEVQPQENMFELIQSLPLPDLLKKFLVYNITL